MVKLTEFFGLWTKQDIQGRHFGPFSPFPNILKIKLWKKISAI